MALTKKVFKNILNVILSTPSYKQNTKEHTTTEYSIKEGMVNYLQIPTLPPKYPRSGVTLNYYYHYSSPEQKGKIEGKILKQRVDIHQTLNSSRR